MPCDITDPHRKTLGRECHEHHPIPADALRITTRPILPTDRETADLGHLLGQKGALHPLDHLSSGLALRFRDRGKRDDSCSRETRTVTSTTSASCTTATATNAVPSVPSSILNDAWGGRLKNHKDPSEDAAATPPTRSPETSVATTTMTTMIDSGNTSHRRYRKHGSDHDR